MQKTVSLQRENLFYQIDNLVRFQHSKHARQYFIDPAKGLYDMLIADS